MRWTGPCGKALQPSLSPAGGDAPGRLQGPGGQRAGRDGRAGAGGDDLRKDQSDVWCTVGVSENIIEASWLALVDALEYKLFKDTAK